MVNVLNVKQCGIQATKLQAIIAAISQILLPLMIRATYKLDDVSTTLWVSGTTLDSKAKIYNVNFQETDKKRLCELMEFTRTSKGE